MIPLSAEAFYVDNSMLEAITTCPWLAYATILRRRRPAGDSPALRFGGLIHRALAYRGRMEWFAQQRGGALDLERVEHHQIKALQHLFTSTLEQCPFEGYRNATNAIKVIRYYNARYRYEQWSIATNPLTGFAYVEQPFAVDTHRTIRGRKIVYIGRIDRKIILNSQTFIVDHKTTKLGGDQFWQEQQMTGQHKGYVWADRECCAAYGGQESTGYFVDQLVIRDSIENAEYEPNLEMIVPNSTKSKAVPVELQRQPFFTKVPSRQIDEWFENMLLQCDEFLYNVDRNAFPRHYKHCVGKYGLCPMFNVCSLPAESREGALMSGAYQENEWSPLYV